MVDRDTTTLSLQKVYENFYTVFQRCISKYSVYRDRTHRGIKRDPIEITE